MSPEGAVRFCWGRDVGLYRCPRGAEGVSGHIQGGIYADVSATKKRQSVARECRAALLENDVGLERRQGCRRCLRAYSRQDQCVCFGNEKVAKCCQRVSRGSVGERYGALMSPKDIAQNCWGTFWGCNVARGCRTALLWNDVGLKRRPRV